MHLQRAVAAVMTHDCVSCGAELHMHCPHCTKGEIAALKAEVERLQKELLALEDCHYYHNYDKDKRQAKAEALREVRDYLLSVGFRDTGDDAEIDYLNDKLKQLEAEGR